jgi:hypothetical protein
MRNKITFDVQTFVSASAMFVNRAVKSQFITTSSVRNYELHVTWMFVTLGLPVFKNSVPTSNKVQSILLKRVVNNPALYSGGPGFKSRPGDRLFWGFRGITPGEFLDSAFKLGHHLFFPNPFPFIIYLPPFYSTLYSPGFWKRVVKYISNKRQYIQQ